MTSPAGLDHSVELIHRVAGYPLAFVIAPWALATFAGARGHRGVGRAYALMMTFLYASGTVLTLTRHPWDSWGFGRNVVFNLLGYSFVLHGWRAVWLLNRPQAPRPTILDRALLAQLALTVFAMAALAVPRNTPLRIFSLVGFGLLYLDWKDHRAGLATPILFQRHLRYMIASYFYVLTVVSLVHLRDELPTDGRWLWPTGLAMLALWMMSGPRLAGIRRLPARRWAVRGTIAVTLVFGAYALWEILRDLPVSRSRAGPALRAERP